MNASFLDLPDRGRAVRVEIAWVGPGAPERPLLVLLHEGLGSIAMWRDFPARLCAALGCRGLVYSRPGYGRSTPRPAGETWAPDYLHRQALDLLPALLDALEVRRPCVLFGHSDGGSIALIHAARLPERVAALVVLAPHIFVEPVALAGIRAARASYGASPEMRQRLARYHDDVDSAFFGWNDAWLAPAFAAWNIEALLGDIRCPVLAIQGEEDEYGTFAQIDGIAARVPATTLLKLADCGHVPHRDRPAEVIEATRALFDAGSASDRGGSLTMR
jgi:pimeloyl-ACP methyl ester carboxylesterase